MTLSSLCKIWLCMCLLTLSSISVAVDSDGDGYTDQEETDMGTNPQDLDSFPASGLSLQLIKVILDIKNDVTAPIITLTGANPQIITTNTPYTELGATTDTGEIPSIDTSALNLTLVGSYTVRYTAVDRSGNVAGPVTRTVNVVESASTEPPANTNSPASGDQSDANPDNAAPVITLYGENPQTVTLNSTYQEFGAFTDTGEAVAIDASLVNTLEVGSYDVTYNVTDAAGNSAKQTARTVNVVALTLPLSEHSVLTAIVDNIVIPNHKLVSEQANLFSAENGPLKSYCKAIGTSQELVKLAAAKVSWQETMQSIQRTELHIIGPSGRNGKSLRNRIYFYDEDERNSTCGTDVSVVKAHSESDFDVAVTLNESRSMSAIEYLLFNPVLEHSCRDSVSAVFGWNTLSEADRKARRCSLSELLASDVASNAAKIHNDWQTYRDGFLDPYEIGTNFELMTDGLFYFEKFTKSAKLTTPLGLDPNCTDGLTCASSIESPHSGMSLKNIQVNAEQLLAIFDAGVDDLADRNNSTWSATFKDLITAVIGKAKAMRVNAPDESIKDQVEGIETSSDASACNNAYTNPDSNLDPQACTFAGLIKRVTDDLKIEFVTYLGVSTPSSVQGDND